jgi:hypothetical protein
MIFKIKMLPLLGQRTKSKHQSDLDLDGAEKLFLVPVSFMLPKGKQE